MSRYNIVVADPAWSFVDKLEHSDVARGAEANYNTMSMDDIKKLRVNELADPEGAILALWVPSSLLQEGLDAMKAWSFQQKQTYIWNKCKIQPLEALSDSVKKTIRLFNSDKSELKETVLNTIKSFNLNDTLAFGMGRLFRQTHEICLIGTNNNSVYKKLKNKSQRSVSFATNFRHSAKPENLQDSLDIMFPDPNDLRIELFARRQRPGWTCIGNQAPATFGEDIRESIDKLLK